MTPWFNTTRKSQPLQCTAHLLGIDRAFFHSAAGSRKQNLVTWLCFNTHECSFPLIFVLWREKIKIWNFESLLKFVILNGSTSKLNLCSFFDGLFLSKHRRFAIYLHTFQAISQILVRENRRFLFYDLQIVTVWTLIL